MSATLNPLPAIAGEPAAIRAVSIAGFVLLAAAYLLPAGDAPWFSFWREWTAALAVLVTLLGAASQLRWDRRPLRLPGLSLPALALGLAILPWLQWWAGIQFYRGDALLVSGYLVAFAACVVVAQSLAPAARERFADRLAIALLAAALLSVPLAVLQWVGWLRLDLDMKVGAGRPVAHMEQTNLLCSLLIQGLFAAWRLHQRRRLRTAWAVAMAVALLGVVSLTQSRVAWLVGAATVGVWLWRATSLNLRRQAPALLGALLLLAVGVVVLPHLDAALGLAGLSVGDRVSGGRRPDAWWLFVDAVRERPWAGWGTMQNGAAQYGVADRHPSLMYVFGSAHDVVLDLMVWFGLPIGLLAGGGLVVVVLKGLRRAQRTADLATALAACALLMHGLVELPLQYAYFLLPLGLMIGLGADVSEARRGGRLDIPTQGSGVIAAIAIPATLFLALVGRDYITLSDNRPFLMFDRPTRHLVLGTQAPYEAPLLLDQLAAYQRFAMIPTDVAVDAATVAGARRPMLRFPSVPSQEHYALILSMSGQPAAARDALGRECKFMTPLQCTEGQGAWATWRSLGQPLPEWP